MATKPTEPPLTCSLNESNRTQFESCSEVVERLDGLVIQFRKEATAILHSWRERRVQELEAALRAIKRELRAISRDGLLTKGDIQLLEAAESVVEDALASKEQK